MIEVQAYPQYKYAAECIADDFTYGDLISKEYLENKLGFKKPKTIAEYQAQQLKKLADTVKLKEFILETYMYYLIPENGGYRIVKPREQTKIVVDRLKKSLDKTMRDSAKGLKNVNHSKLTNDEINENTRAMNVLGAMKLFAKKGKKKFRFLTKGSKSSKGSF